MKKLIVLLLAVLLVAALCACGESKPADLSFKNSLNVTVHNFYVSPVTDEEWSDPVNNSKINKGSTIQFDFTKVSSTAGPGNYDIGAIDENSINYDLYEVPLAVGDKIELSGNSSKATFTITHADGKTESFDAYIYSN